MPTTHLFETLDAATRDYLLKVRVKQGKGSPGIFVPVKNSLPVLGLICGPILVATTLICTLIPGPGIIYDDPKGVALLQTAGLLLGGWMFVAAIRVWARKGSEKYAGNWLYADPLFLYEANGEKVKVTPLDEVRGAEVTQNYNNGSYQNSAVRIRLPGKQTLALTLTHERRAERLIVYLNYLSWARGEEGGARAALAPALLGGLAVYVSKNENEPLDANSNVDLGMAEPEIGDLPAEHKREGHAALNVLPYIVLLVAGVACFFVMVQVNIPLRDDAIYAAVVENPMEPRRLRSYLIDPRNTVHRQQVYDHLPPFYDSSINFVRTNAQDATLKKGFIDVLDSLRRADQPVVSIRVVETKSPAGKEAGKEDRTKALMEGIANRTNDEFGKVAPPVQPPPEVVFTEQPPPVGHQLIAFAAMPEDAVNPHFDISYAFVPEDDRPGRYRVAATVTIRVNVEDAPVAAKTFGLPVSYTADQTDAAVIELKEAIIRNMVGVLGNPMVQPKFNFPPLPDGDL